MSGTADLDTLSINTIRTLSMDAVQAANSGHPGTPMSMAPVVYTLWQNFLRFDPSDPIWPNRDRFVLSAGHASMLLYSMLHLTGTKAVIVRVRGRGRAVGLARATSRSSASSTARRPVTPSIASPRASRRRPARSARVAATASAWRWPASGSRPLQQARLRALRLQRLRPLRRRRHDGGHLERGRVARRPPASSRTSAGSTTATGSRSRATPTSPSPRTSASAFEAYGWKVHHVADANDREALSKAIEDVQEHDRPADVHHRPQQHRLRRAAQAGHQGGPRRAARRGGGQARPRSSTAGPRTTKFSSPTASTSTSRRASAQRGQGAARRLVRQARRLQDAVPGARRRARPDAAPPAPGRLGQGHPDVPARSEGPGHARLLGPGAQRDRQERPVAHRRRGRPRAVDQDAPDVRGRRRLRSDDTMPAATSTSASASTRWPRSLNGMALSKVRPFGSGFLIFSDYARPADPPQRDHGDPAIHVFTHDSIGVGEDGPTHQPVEQLAVAPRDPRLLR